MAKKSVDSRKRTARSGNGREFDGPRADENSLRPELARTEKSRQEREEFAAQNENTIRARRARHRSNAPSNEPDREALGRQGAATADSRAVPDYINARYIKVGNKYHFPNGDPAFKDRGRAVIDRIGEYRSHSRSHCDRQGAGLE